MSRTPETANLILVNGKVVTVDPLDTIAEAVAVKDGRIVEVGDNSKIRGLAAPNAKVIDLKGRTLTPGLIDSHSHLASTGVMALHVLDVSYRKVKSIRDIVRLVEERVKQTPKGAWIQGQGWAEALFEEKRYPTRWDLDPVSPDNPVVLSADVGHYLVANSLALRLANISKDTPDPVGGTIGRDPNTREPTGILKEFPASEKVRDLVPPWSADQYEEGIRHAFKLWAEEGITATKEPSFSKSIYPTVLAAYRKLKQRDEMTVRCYLVFRAESRDDVRFAASHPEDFLAHKDDDLLRMAGIKGFIDGSLVARTCWMYEEYWDHDKGEPEKGNRGYPVITAELLNEIVEAANEAGFQMHVHAIGDRGVDVLIDAYEKALKKHPRQDHRHSVIHGIVLTKDAIRRIKELGVIVETQSPFLYFLGDGYTRAVRAETLKRVIPLRSLIDAGITVGNGADSYVCPHPPRYGMWAACTRRTMTGREGAGSFGKEECTSMVEALRTYTIWGARCLFMEDKIGSIEKGKYADLVVWEKDLLTIPVDEVKDLKVLMTILNGKVIYERPGSW